MYRCKRIKVEKMSALMCIFLATFVGWNSVAADVIPKGARLDYLLDLMRDLHKDAGHDENIIISPQSILVVLSTTYEASTGKTREELASYLGLPSQDDESAKATACRAKLLKQILNNSSLPFSELSVAAGFFIQKDLTIRQEFADEMRNKYTSEIANLDFSSSGKEAAAVVNKYVADATKDRISSMLSSDFDPTSQAVIVSALYFYAVWKDTFIKSETKPAKFNTGLEEIEVQMMRDLKRVLYYDDPSLMFEAIQLPFKKNDEYLLAIVLPYKGQTLTNLTNHMTGNDLEEALFNATKANVEYQIPRMKFSSKKSLKSVLAKEGLNSLFEKTQFSKLTSANSLTVTDFLHAAEIEVDERGMKSGAGTAVPFPTFAIDFLFDQKSFLVNRPYWLIVYNRPNFLVLHSAFVHKPNAGTV